MSNLSFYKSHQKNSTKVTDNSLLLIQQLISDNELLNIQNLLWL